LSEYLQKPNLFGVDDSPVAINYAKKRGHKNIIKVDAKKLPFEDHTFDYILLLDVLEHIKDDAAVLIEAGRVLKKDGKIIITTPALQFIWSEHDSEQGHFRRYVRRRIRKIASTAKLSVNRISYFNFFLSPAIIGIRLLSRLKPFDRFGKFDSKLNFNVAKKTFVNELLKLIFVSEIKLLKYVSYPFGISIFAILEKN